jgi:hypothetical protein
MVFKYHLSKIAKIADEDVSVNTLEMMLLEPRVTLLQKVGFQYNLLM